MDDISDESVLIIIKRFSFGVILDLAVSITIAILISDSGKKTQTVAVLFVSILALRLIVGCRNWLHGTLWTYLYARKVVRQKILDTLRKEKFPPPKDYYYRSDYLYYMKYLAENEYVDAVFRVKAAAAYMGFNVVRQIQSNTEWSMFKDAANEAFRLWAKEAEIRSKKELGD